jgi:SPP1 gp7 family putative phage head morphogenesis protein
MAIGTRKRLRPKNPNDKVLRPVHPNAGLTAAYRKKLDALIDEMEASVSYWLSASYKANEPRIAQDELPASALKAAIRKLTARWQKRFNDAAPKLADYYATAIEKRSSAALKAILKESGISVEFKLTSSMRDVLNATVNQNVSLIKSIPSEYFTQIEGAVMRSVTVGRDLGSLAKELEEHYGVTRRRAATIARSQNNLATSSMDRARRLELGLDESQWMHSGAGKHKRPTHVAMSGKRFKTEQGMWDPAVKRYVFAGCEPGCRCVSRAVVKGFS